MMKVRYAKPEDYGQILIIDEGIDFRDFQRWTDNKQVMFIYENEDFCGWLQFGFLFEKIPFINRFYIMEEFRGLGNGTLTLLIWERQMMERMYDTFMLSTAVTNTKAQEFYEKHGYQKVGQLTLPDHEHEEEIFYYKHKPLF